MAGPVAPWPARRKCDLGILPYFRRCDHRDLNPLLDLQEELADLLAGPINFAFASEMRPWLREWIEEDRIEIF